VILKHAARWLSDEEVNRIVLVQGKEVERRCRVLRGGKPLPLIAGKTVILVDDGLAMGSTMSAAVLLCRKKHAAKVVVAVPVSGSRVAKEIDGLADETIILEIPSSFQAVAQVYRNWYDVSDGEVRKIMRKWKR